MKDKTYYQEMLLHLVEPLKKHYSKDCASLQLGAFAAGYGSRLPEWKGFPVFYGAWYPTGLAEKKMKASCRFTKRDYAKEPTLHLKDIGETCIIKTRGWLRWRRSVTEYL